MTNITYKTSGLKKRKKGLKRGKAFRCTKRPIHIIKAWSHQLKIRKFMQRQIIRNKQSIGFALTELDNNDTSHFLVQTQRYFRSSLLSTRTGNTSALARYPLHNSNAKFFREPKWVTWTHKGTFSSSYNLGEVPYNVSIGTLVVSKLLSQVSLKDRVFSVLVTSSSPSSSWLLKLSIRLLRNERGIWAHMSRNCFRDRYWGHARQLLPNFFSLFSVTVQKSLRMSTWSSFLLSVYQSIFFFCWLSSICSDILSLASCQWHGLVSSKVG